LAHFFLDTVYMTWRANGSADFDEIWQVVVMRTVYFIYLLIFLAV